MHILRMVIEPAENQHPSMYKSYLGIEKLEETTWDASWAWFKGENSPGFVRNVPILNAIFRIARHEESYKHGKTGKLFCRIDTREVH